MTLLIGETAKVLGAKDVPADIFINKASAILKESLKFDIPNWINLVKSGSSRELAPYDADFIYIRAASILRKLAFNKKAGVKTLRREYGKNKNRGVAPSHHSDASGKIIRYCLQELNRLGLVAGDAGKVRKLTSKGRAAVDQIARQC